MISYRESCRRSITANFAKAIVALVAITLFASITVVGQLNLWDAAQGLPDLDNRAGQLAPTAEQLALVSNLGAKAEWNQFGTVKAMLKYGGFISTSFWASCLRYLANTCAFFSSV